MPKGKSAIRAWWWRFHLAKHLMRHVSGERGITLVQLVTALLLLGILSVVAVLNYLNAESTAKSQVDRGNVIAINIALALYNAQNNGIAHQTKPFAAFLGNTNYFPHGAPTDPYRNPADSVPYTKSYDAALCRVQMISGGIDHTTGAGH